MCPSADQIEKSANMSLEEIISQDLTLLYFSQTLRGAFNIKGITRIGEVQLEVEYFSRPGLDDEYTSKEICTVSDEARFNLFGE